MKLRAGSFTRRVAQWSSVIFAAISVGWRVGAPLPAARSAQSASTQPGGPTAPRHPYRVSAPSQAGMDAMQEDTVVDPAPAAGVGGLNMSGAATGIGAPGGTVGTLQPRASGGMSRATAAQLSGAARPTRSGDVTVGIGPAVSPVRVEVALVRVRGAVSSEDALRAMRSHEAAVGQCYLAALMANPSAQGMLLMRVRWSPDGRTLDSRVVADYVQHAATVDCIARVLSSLPVRRFAGTQPAIGTYRIHLERNGS